MTSFAVGYLRDVKMCPEIAAYLEGMDATLAPFGGRFVLHGDGNRKVLEGNWSGDLIIIAFPDRQSAEAWYASPAYQKILPLRAKNCVGEVFLVDGVEDGHKATDILE